MRGILASVVIALAAGSVTAQQIGQVASIDPNLRGGDRVLSLGSGVSAGEVVSSNASGRGQLLFLDQTTLSIAPNSTITLDRFVYDPNRDAGDVALGMTRGALRFIGGRSTIRREAEINTPTATIGIRGSSALILVQGDRTFAVFIAGKRLCLTVRATGQRRCTNRRGALLSDDGYRGRVQQDFLSDLVALIDGAPGAGQGGAQTTLSGILRGASPDRRPISSTGEERDDAAQDAGLVSDTVINVIPLVPFDNETPIETPEVVEPPQPPVVEVPVVEEPVVEEPVVEEPVNQDPIVVLPVEQDPVVEEPLVEVPAVNAPINEVPEVTDEINPDLL